MPIFRPGLLQDLSAKCARGEVGAKAGHCRAFGGLTVDSWEAVAESPGAGRQPATAIGVPDNIRAKSRHD